MTDERMALLELIEKGADADLVRDLLAYASERLMAAEVDQLTGAAAGVRAVVDDLGPVDNGEDLAARWIDVHRAPRAPTARCPTAAPGPCWPCRRLTRSVAW